MNHYRLFAGVASLLLASAAVAGPAAANAAAPVKPYVVGVRTVSVKGHEEPVLVSAGGMTLYYFTKDTASKAACTGACAKIWPPLTVSTAKVVAAKGIPGTFTLLGHQVEYDGHPLYLFSGDHKPGQANGQGFKHLWWVATPGLKPLAAAPAKGTSTKKQTPKAKVAVSNKKKAAPATKAAAPYQVGVRTVSVKGHAEAVLVSATGMTLYYFTKDTASKVACTGACAKIWPPLTVSTAKVVAAKGIPGTFTLLGHQVEYDGHPL
jgi:predicted lipoprotein with Yx(FWY)xxD motif